MSIPFMRSAACEWHKYPCSLTGVLVGLSLSCTSGIAQVAPTMEGQTIMMPGDGWYQVQSRSDYREICAGVSSCEVPMGRYIVINHTTGERFEDIRVELGPVEEEQIVITANGVSWPDDGWYQVQRAGTYESLCQGGRSCSLAPGEYIVINHTSGRRWENIVVPGDDGSSLQAIDLRHARYSSSAIELFWARQAGAQSPIEYTVFQDGVVIGSTRGTSFFIEGLAADQAYEFDIRPFDLSEGVSITVPASTDASASERQLRLDNAQELLASLVDVINEEAIDGMYDSAAEDLNFQNKAFFISNTIDDIVLLEGGEQNPPWPVENVYGEEDYHDGIRYATYTCAAGGSVTVYQAYSINSSDAVFDRCVAGNNTYSGTSGIRNLVRGSIVRYPAYDFSVTDSNGNTQTLSGGYAYGNTSFVATNIESGWDSAEYAGPVEGGQLQVRDYSMTRRQIDNNSGIGSVTLPGDDGQPIRVLEYRVENTVQGSFAVSAPWTGGKTLQVVVDLGFEDDVLIASDPETGESVPYSRADPEESFFWQQGTIEIRADDGSRLYVTPVEGERDTFMIESDDGGTLGPLLWNEGYAVQP
ncbi:hypothetical protein ACUNV4_12655 [Granulosicoccus sp. 3-233]|uniref:hypothetical protein n=1 Tax=Granulosicoccus sp. 3-233 TaxID=3417969 RepID=UPI003D34F8D5